jgi:hypothetical protein
MVPPYGGRCAGRASSPRVGPLINLDAGESVAGVLVVKRVGARTTIDVVVAEAVGSVDVVVSRPAWPVGRKKYSK